MEVSFPLLSVFTAVREGSEAEARSTLEQMFRRLEKLNQRRCKALKDRDVLPGRLLQLCSRMDFLWEVVFGEETEPLAAAEEEAAQVLGEEPTQPGLISEELKVIYLAMFRSPDESSARSEWVEFVEQLLTELQALVQKLDIEVAGPRCDVERMREALKGAERMLEYASEQQARRTVACAHHQQLPGPLLSKVDRTELECLQMRLGGGSYGKVSLVHHEGKTCAFKETRMRDDDKEVRVVRGSIGRIGLGLSVN